MWPEFLCSQQYSLFLVIGCHWDLHLGLLSFFCVFYHFLTSFTLSHIPSVLFHLLSSFSAPFYFLLCLFPGTFGRDRQNASVPSLVWHLSKAPSFLLVIVPPLEAQLEFLHSGTLQKQIKICYSEVPWPLVLWIWGDLSSLISFSVCTPTVLSSTPSSSTPSSDDGPFSAAKEGGISALLPTKW